MSVLVGDCVDVLSGMPDGSVHCCVTSPPYFGLRDYGTGVWEGGNGDCDHARQSPASRASSGLDGATTTQGGAYAFGAECGKCGATRVDRQIGLEATPDEYVARLVGVFGEVKRVLRGDGTLWLNLGDSYYAPNATGNAFTGGKHATIGVDTVRMRDERNAKLKAMTGFKPKDLMGVPWMVAFALRADGWFLRSEIIWAKLNPMPESVTDRPTKAHEQVFLLSKSPRYFYDADAIAERALQPEGPPRLTGLQVAANGGSQRVVIGGESGTLGTNQGPSTRNKRSVWTVSTMPYPDAHFATFPPKLIEPMILAGCPRGGTVLDPFAGSGTTLQAARANGREAVGIELNPEYAAMAERRLAGVTSSMFDVEAA